MKPLALAGLVLLAAPVAADTDIFSLTGAERRAFQAEVRALLLDEPEIVRKALAPPPYQGGVYAEAAAADLDTLNTLKSQVLSGAKIALFVGEGCEDCARAIEELQVISETIGQEFILHDISDPAVAKVAATLEMDDLPFYVMSDRILRGWMPAMVLTRYLSDD